MAKEKFDDNFSVFDAPAEHNDKKSGKSKRKIISLIIGVLCVGLVVGAVFIVDKFMPEQQEEADENAVEPFKIIEVSTDTFKNVTVTSKEGTVELYAEEQEVETEDGDTETEKNWYIKGYEKKDVSSAIASLLSSASNITAYSEITKKTALECGFDAPRYTVKVETDDNKGFTILVGDDSPDNFGMYLKFADSEEIYLVSEELLDNFIIDAKSIMESITNVSDT